MSIDLNKWKILKSNRIIISGSIYKILFMLLFLFIKVNGITQSTNLYKDSLVLYIKYDSLKCTLSTEFINKSKDKLLLPWQERLPYSNFIEDSVQFNIYLGIGNKVTVLKITESIPDFIFEENNIEIKAQEMVIKEIDLEGMISKKDIKLYDFIYTQYILTNSLNSPNSKLVFTSNRIFFK